MNAPTQGRQRGIGFSLGDVPPTMQPFFNVCVFLTCEMLLVHINITWREIGLSILAAAFTVFLVSRLAGLPRPLRDSYSPALSAMAICVFLRTDLWWLNPLLASLGRRGGRPRHPRRRLFPRRKRRLFHECLLMPNPAAHPFFSRIKWAAEPYELHFGVPEGKEVVRLEVRWPNMQTTSHEGLTPGFIYTLFQ